MKSFPLIKRNWPFYFLTAYLKFVIWRQIELKIKKSIEKVKISMKVLRKERQTFEQNNSCLLLLLSSFAFTRKVFFFCHQSPIFVLFVSSSHGKSQTQLRNEKSWEQIRRRIDTENTFLALHSRLEKISCWTKQFIRIN